MSYKEVTVRGEDIKKQLLQKDEELDDDFLDDLLGDVEESQEEETESSEQETPQENEEALAEKEPENNGELQSLFTPQQLAQLAQHCTAHEIW